MMLRSSAWLWRTSQPRWKARESHRSRSGGCSIASGQENWRWEQTINPNDLFAFLSKVTSSFSHMEDPIWLLVTGYQMMNSMFFLYEYNFKYYTTYIPYSFISAKEGRSCRLHLQLPSSSGSGPSYPCRSPGNFGTQLISCHSRSSAP